MAEQFEQRFSPQKDESKKEKAPHFISSRLLKALGGMKDATKAGDLVNEGAYLWGVEDRDKGKGIFRHVLLTSRAAYFLGKALKDKGIPEYQGIDLKSLVESAILHDVTKLYGEDREKLSPELKSAIGIDDGFREISSEVDEKGISWLKDLGFPPEVYEAIKGHDFPEAIVENPYWKIVLLADYMSSQEIMPVKKRLEDVKARWIDQQIAKGEEPRIEPERFAIAQKNIEKVAKEIFDILGIEDEKFIEDHKLNSDESKQRWEKFLNKTRDEKSEDRAKKHVTR